jgi:hypothetical protein
MEAPFRCNQQRFRVVWTVRIDSVKWLGHCRTQLAGRLRDAIDGNPTAFRVVVADICDIEAGPGRTRPDAYGLPIFDSRTRQPELAGHRAGAVQGIEYGFP